MLVEKRLSSKFNYPFCNEQLYRQYSCEACMKGVTIDDLGCSYIASLAMLATNKRCHAEDGQVALSGSG